jgi:hypothetical protein
VSVLPAVVAVGAATLLWLAYRHAVGCLGAFLALMPLFTVAFLLAKFFGPPFIARLEGCDRAVILLVTFILWWRNGITLATPDWLLLICFGMAALRLPFDGSLIGLASDFGFVIAYAAGRVAGLTVHQEQIWAKRAVWIAAAVSALGLGEVFILGEGPRTMLYLSVADAATQGEALDGSFRAIGFTGLRVSGTMFGPLQFAPLCMAALIFWWVYSRKPLYGGAIAIALIGTLTRSAWLGTALAIPVLAVVMEQKKRFFMYTALALFLFVASIPFLGVGDYLASTRAGEDPSAQGHQDSIFRGLEFISSHPLGVGSANFGRQAAKDNTDASFFESAYLTLAGEYGLPVVLCFIGFLFSAMRTLWPRRTKLSYVGIGIIAGFAAVMGVVAIHDVFPLACWIWFPVGLAVTSSVKQSVRQPLSASAFESFRGAFNARRV